MRHVYCLSPCLAGIGGGTLPPVAGTLPPSRDGTAGGPAPPSTRSLFALALSPPPSLAPPPGGCGNGGGRLFTSLRGAGTGGGISVTPTGRSFGTGGGGPRPDTGGAARWAGGDLTTTPFRAAGCGAGGSSAPRGFGVGAPRPPDPAPGRATLPAASPHARLSSLRFLGIGRGASTSSSSCFPRLKSRTLRARGVACGATWRPGGELGSASNGLRDPPANGKPTDGSNFDRSVTSPTENKYFYFII